jgi:hypothetical protein
MAEINITNIPSTRIDFIDKQTGLMSREWYRFFLNLFTLTGGGSNAISLDELQIGPPTGSGGDGGAGGTVTSVAMSVPTGLSVAGSPITSVGTLAVSYASGYAIPTTAKQTQWDTAYAERQQWDGGATNLVAATGRTSLGATTVGGNFFTLPNPSAITFVRINADNTVSTLDAATFRTAIGAGTGGGTVTSVSGTTGNITSTGGATPVIDLASGIVTPNTYGSALLIPVITVDTYGRVTTITTAANPQGTVTSVSGAGTVSGLTLTGTVTSSGSLTLGGTLAVTPSDFASQTANTFLAAPNGAPGVPTFRAIVAADVPTLNQNTSGSAATLTTGRTIAITGDLAYTSPSFDGSTNVTAAGTLATVNATVGSFTNASITVNGKGLVTAASSGTAPVTSVTGTSPVASSGGATPAISLTAGYGDTLNPYASKTANYVLAAPNGTAGVPTFRAVVAADVPTLNQNTTGTASNVTGTVAIANGGTGQTTATAAFNALAPTTTKGDLIVRNGTGNIRVAVGADTYALVADSTTASGVKWAAAGASLTIANDTTTATNLYPTFLTATSGTATTLYTGNAKLLYKPSTGEFTAPAHISSNGITINSTTVSTSYTIASGSAGVSAGPMTVSSGVVVTVSSGSRWVVL